MRLALLVLERGPLARWRDDAGRRPALRKQEAHAPRSPRHRARSALVLGFCLIVVAQIGLTAAVETVRPQWRDPEYGHRLHRLRELRAAHPDRPLVVAIGSSRTQMGVSPADMGLADEPGSPVVFNFGQAGAGPLHQLLTVRRLLDAGVKPDYLLVEFFPGALVVDGPAEDVMRAWGPRLGLGDARRLGPYCADADALRRRWAADRLAPWHSLRLSLMSHWRPRWVAWPQRLDFQWEMMDRWGFTAYPIDPVPEAKRADGLRLAREQYAPYLGAYRIGATSDRALRDLLGLCRAEGIPAALYLTPEGPEFRAWYAAETRGAVAAYRAGLAAEFGVPVWAAGDDFGEDQFADGHHLLRAGAARFSRRLADHVRTWSAERKGATPP
ncbi:MAG: DUF1574 domain-containing protein [Gemmataceae bacterium]|nr:DUF1574 domain-containing protein [Gemmataceae bacterium]